MGRARFIPSQLARRDPLVRVDEERGVMGLLLSGLLLAGLLIYWVAVWNDWLPWLRGWGDYPQGWTWRTFPVPPLERFLPVVGIIAAVWVTIAFAELSYGAPWLASRPAGNRTVVALYLLVMVLLGWGLQLGLLGLKAENPNQLLVERVTNRTFAGYFNHAASAGSIDAFFSGYPSVFNTKICPHCHDHPPGPSLYYWLDIQAASTLPKDWQRNLANATWDLLGTSETTYYGGSLPLPVMRNALTNSQILGAFGGGTLVLVLASMVVIPLFGLARLLAPRGYEFRLAGLGLALPGLMLMAPEFDQVLATITAAAVYTGVRGLITPRAFSAAVWGGVTGLLIAAGLLFSWALMILLAVLGFLGLAAAFFTRRMLTAREPEQSALPAVGQLLAWGAALVVGLAGSLILLALATKIDLVQIFRYNTQNAARAEEQRPYWVWLFFGPLDFVQFLGLPLALAALASLVVQPWTKYRAVTSDQSPPLEAQTMPKAPWYTTLNVYALVFWLVIVGLDLAGRSKAEQGRLLIFMMPIALAAFYFWVGRNRARPGIVAQLFFAQIAVCVILGARWFVP